MNTCKWANLLLLSLILWSCTSKKPALRDFDSGVWKEDRNGCNNKRKLLSEQLLQQKDALLGLDEMEIVKILGKPDENELYKRNQKFYYYAIDPAAPCPSADNANRQLVIRFNAVGLAKEILIE